METLPLIFIALLGLVAGSFTLAMTMRMMKRKPWVNDRSECDHCKKKLQPVDLIPLFSWLSTGGRCRYCKKKLSWLYPVTELAVAASFTVSYLFWPYGFSKMGILMFAVWLVMLTLMAALFVFDIKWMILPDKITYPLIAIALASKLFQMAFYENFDRLPGIAIGVLLGGGIFFSIYVLSRGKYIGGGDIKLGIFYGILMASGFKSLLVMCIGSMLGTLYMIPALVSRKSGMTTKMPYGPFLLAAIFIIYIFGDRIIELMTSTYLFP